MLIVLFELAQAFSCIEPGKRITEHATTCLERLSRALDAPNLVLQFKGFFEHARCELVRYGTAFDVAWRNSVVSYRSGTGASRRTLETDDLFGVVKRQMVLVPCTSTIEQSFSYVDKKMDWSRLGMDSATENMLLGRPFNFNLLENCSLTYPAVLNDAVAK